ncbi:hypothetical protein Barb6XT_02130 [Bacteroidales bacterium Barb6XT]|nr:hypothetical protein Barb6XT_02130 [Bacteroidales bacterium Barb6XT]
MEEQAYTNVKHPSNPDYPEDKDFKEGVLRDVLVIIYGASYNSHFVMRNVTKIQQRCFGLWMYFTIDDYDSRSYDKQNLDALGWHYTQYGHELSMNLLFTYWDYRIGDVGAFDNYPRMDIRIKPFGTVVRDCDLPPRIISPTEPVNILLPSHYVEYD